MSEVLRYIPYVLLFMVATMLIYGWGLWRTQRQIGDLTRQLYAKARSRVKRAVRKNGRMTRKDLIPVVQNLTARQPFSSKQLGVTDPDKFLDALLDYMLLQKDLRKEQQGSKTYYVLER